MSETFCLKCGRALTTVGLTAGFIKYCPRHGSKWHKEEPKELRGRYSGKSKRGIKGGYENE